MGKAQTTNLNAPWEADESFIGLVRDKNGRVVAKTDDWGTGVHLTPEQNKYHARLIASIPLLLKTLEEIARCGSWHNDVDQIVQDVSDKASDVLRGIRP